MTKHANAKSSKLAIALVLALAILLKHILCCPSWLCVSSAGQICARASPNSPLLSHPLFADHRGRDKLLVVPSTAYSLPSLSLSLSACLCHSTSLCLPLFPYLYVSLALPYRSAIPSAFALLLFHLSFPLPPPFS